MFLTSLCAALAMQSSAIVVDPSVRYQKWEGWGTSLCWWAYVVGGYPSTVREDLMQKLFVDLKMNVVRYNIGGGEAPDHHHMQYRAELPGYLSPDGKWDWNADATQRWVLQRAKELGATRFESFSNSPPYWMTLSGCASGGKDGKKDNLAPDKYNAFADYLVEVNEHFRTHWGITFETLEPLNEPDSDWWTSGGRQEGCHISAGTSQSGLIEALHASLTKRKSPTKIAASDENTIDLAVKSWDALTPSAKDKVWRINAHHYGGTQQLQLQERAAKAGKKVWMSEEGDNDRTGLTMAARIVKDIRDMQATAWVYWQAVEQVGAGWGMIEMDLNNRHLGYTVLPKYHVFANFSRFIPEGSQFVSINDPNSVAAIHGRELTIVTVNQGPAKEIELDLSQFAKRAEATAISTVAEQPLAKEKVTLEGGKIRVKIRAGSVTTLQVAR